MAGLTERGRLAAVRVGRALHRVREALGLPLPDLVILAEEALGLDVELAARVGNPLGRRAVDALRATAEQFSAEMETPTLADFLAWLDTAEERENGLEAPEVTPEPGAVQVLTVHASKGLEWDVVAVCGLDEQVFPSYRSKPTEDLSLAVGGWLTSQGEFPHPLRADADTLPPFTLSAWDREGLTKDEVEEVKNALDSYRLALGRHELAEERRLAYVAFTRARHALLLTGSHLAKSGREPRTISRFLGELIRRDLVTPYGAGWTQPDPQATNPLVTRVLTGTWPLPVPSAGTGHDTDHPGTPEPPPGSAAHKAARRVRARREAALAVAEARRQLAGADGVDGSSAPAGTTGSTRAGAPAPTGPQAPSGPHVEETDTLAERWDTEVDLLLAERDRHLTQVPQVRLPAHLAATRLAALGTDLEAFALDLRRPLPPRPNPTSRLGTVFHEAVAQHLAAAAGLFTLQDAGVPDTLSTQDRERVRAWIDVVDSLDLLDGYQLVATETERELTIGDVTIRCRMDAVFTRQGPEGPEWLIVDWKTGRQDVPVEQLSVYVHAWASTEGVDPSRVRAAYVHVARAGMGGTVVEELRAQDLTDLEVLASTLDVEAR